MISIIIPNYNKARYIDQTIYSVIQQTYFEWEIILVDDQSTDGSWEIILDYSKKYDNIMALKPEYKLYGSGCRNYGLKYANGDYILFLDSDDILGKECLENRLKYFSKSPNSDFMVFVTGTFFEEIGDSKNVWRPQGANYLKKFLEHKLPWNIMSVLWKKSTLLKLGGFDEDYSRLQDVELHTRALLLADIKFLVWTKTEPDCYYRIDKKRSDLNISSKVNNQIQGVTTYISKMSKILNRNNELKYLKSTLFSLITHMNFCHISKQIDANEHQEFIATILNLNAEPLKLTKVELSYLSLYISLYKKGFYKLKGFNYITNLIFKNT